MFSSRRSTVPGIQPASTTVGFVLLLLASIWSPAMAGRNANGAMVLHTDDAVLWSAGWDYCARYPLPATCEALNSQTNHVPEQQEAIIWVVGAFELNSSPGVTAYQFGIYHNLPTDYFTAWGPCGPGALEIPDATWPYESGTGTAVAYGSAVYPHFLFKMYWFAVTGQVGTVFSTGAYPYGTDGAAFADDGSPPIVDRCDNFGTVRWGVPGQNQCPPIPTQGACCYPDGTCQFVDQAACQGVFQGLGVPCDPNPCPQPTGACCFTNGHCTVLTQAVCQQQGGTYQGNGTTCNPNPCSQQPIGACCFANGSCSVLTQAGCEQLCGTYQGDHTVCIPNPCTPTPRGQGTRKTSHLASGPTQLPLRNGARHGRPSRNVGGAMVLHVDDSICYSTDIDYCSIDPLPATCADLVTNVTRDPSVEAVVWMVAAFPDNSSPGVTAFQVGIAGDIPADYYTDFAPCGPGVLEIPDATWPAPGTGTACAFGVPVYSRLFKMYWFAVTAPGAGSSISTTNYPNGDHHAEWADDGDPPLIDNCYNFGRVVWGGEGQNQCPGSLQLGACCFADGTCQDLLAEDCGAAGGTFEGPDTSCATFQCPVIGACCFTDGHCTVLTQAQCQQQGGTYRGTGTNCNPNPCPQPPTGACCYPDGYCMEQTQAQCQQQGGSFQGNGTHCNPNPCSGPTGACCFTDGHCTVLTSLQCQYQGGSYRGNGTTCDPNPCMGACCFADGHCTVLTRTQCQQQGGTYQGNATSCTPNPCPPPTGACCFTDGHCTVLMQDVCQQQGGTYQGNGTTCSPNPCPQPTGACCFADGHCTVLTQAQCQQQGGSYQGNSTICDPSPCPQPGACCFAAGHCAILTQPLCEQQGGSFQGVGTNCNPNPCPQPPTGACCFTDGSCSILTQAECEQQCGTYQGDHTACIPDPCTPRALVSRQTSHTASRPTQSPLRSGARHARPSRNVGGAMVLHVDNTVCYSAGSNYCSTDPLPATCFDLVTNVTRNPGAEAMVWMVAAFPDNSSPGVNAFEVGIAGDVPADYYTDFAPCGPGVLEIPDATWPAPGTGTACAFGVPVYSRLFKMYWFAVTAPGTGSSISTTNYPGDDHHAAWADDSSPPMIDYCYNFGRVVWGSAGQNECPGSLQPGACCYPDGRCEFVEPTQCGGVFLGIGVPCDPNPCPQPGACCIGTECVMVLESVCAGQGGTWIGGDCTPVTCATLGACCIGEVCSQTHQADCQGTYLGDGIPCDPNPCIIPIGACCIGQDCTVTTQANCGGTYLGDGIPCDPNPCAGTPVKRTTWGQVKSLFR